MPIEKFDHDEFRDQLAKDLKSIPDHKERKEVLESEQGGARYKEAKTEHIKDIEAFQELLKTSEGKAEVYNLQFWEGVLGKKFAPLFIESGHCSCGLCTKESETDAQWEVYKDVNGKGLGALTEEQRKRAEKSIPYSRALREFQEGIQRADTDKAMKGDMSSFSDGSILDRFLSRKIMESYQNVLQRIGDKESLQEASDLKNLLDIDSDKRYEATFKLFINNDSVRNAILNMWANRNVKCISPNGPRGVFYDRIVKKTLEETKARE